MQQQELFYLNWVFHLTLTSRLRPKSKVAWSPSRVISAQELSSVFHLCPLSITQSMQWYCLELQYNIERKFNSPRFLLIVSDSEFQKNSQTDILVSGFPKSDKLHDWQCFRIVGSLRVAKLIPWLVYCSHFGATCPNRLLFRTHSEERCNKWFTFCTKCMQHGAYTALAFGCWEL